GLVKEYLKPLFVELYTVPPDLNPVVIVSKAEEKLVGLLRTSVHVPDKRQICKRRCLEWLLPTTAFMGPLNDAYRCRLSCSCLSCSCLNRQSFASVVRDTSADTAYRECVSIINHCHQQSLMVECA
ncbi:Protein of unknown function, partial [Gryllus bimaculatus]